MPPEQGGTIQQNLYRVLAAVEFLTDRTKEIAEGAKERDKQLAGIQDSFRTLAEQVRDLARAAKDQQDATAVALRDAKHDTRNSLQVISARMELTDSHVKALDQKYEVLQETVRTLGTTADTLVTQSTATQAAVANTQAAVAKLQKPVQDLLTLRRHVYAFGALFASIFATLWVAGQPLITWTVNHLMSIWFPSEHK